MISKLIIFGLIALIGLCCFITAVIYLTKGHSAEWVTLVLAPISGICLAIVMNYANIDLNIKVALLAKDGSFSFKIGHI